ncbi:MAG: hypothetical protein ACE5JB_11850 [bacterium]
MLKVAIILTSTFILSFSAVGCLNPISTPPRIAIEELLSTPDTIFVEGRKLFLFTSLWRDFQPISPPDGRPLIAIIYIESTDSTQLPASISADAIYIVYRGAVWKSWFSDEPIASDLQKPNRIVRIARNGPKWGPGVFVDVIVLVAYGQNDKKLLRASSQPIERTD